MNRWNDRFECGVAVLQMPQNECTHARKKIGKDTHVISCSSSSPILNFYETHYPIREREMAHRAKVCTELNVLRWSRFVGQTQSIIVIDLHIAVFVWVCVCQTSDNFDRVNPFLWSLSQKRVKNTVNFFFTFRQ